MRSKLQRAVIPTRLEIQPAVAGIWRWSNDMHSLCDVCKTMLIWMKRKLDVLKNRNKFLTGCTNCYITCVYHFCYCVLSSFCPLSVRPFIPLSCWHHNMTSDTWFVTWTIITLNFTGITLAIVFQQYLHIISPKIIICMTAIIIYMLYKKKKFSLTKFCSVWQNLEFCHTNVWQNSGIFGQHWCEVSLFIFYAPGSNDRGHIVFVLSVCLFVCLSVVNFNIPYNFWTVRDRDFIFGMHTPLMMPFQMTPTDQVQWPCDLDFDLCSKNSFFGLCCRQGHSPCFTNTPWFFFIAMYGNNVLHVRPYCVEDLTLIL